MRWIGCPQFTAMRLIWTAIHSNAVSFWTAIHSNVLFSYEFLNSNSQQCALCFCFCVSFSYVVFEFCSLSFEFLAAPQRSSYTCNVDQSNLSFCVEFVWVELLIKAYIIKTAGLRIHAEYIIKTAGLRIHAEYYRDRRDEKILAFENSPWSLQGRLD